MELQYIKKNSQLDTADEFKPAKASCKKVILREIKEPLFLGANRSCIIVHVKNYPRRLRMLAIFSVVVWILFGAMLVIHEADSVNEDFEKNSIRYFGYWRVAGALIELWSAFLAFLLILVSYCFRTWKFLDILTNRRRANSLTDLISSLKDDRRRAIHLCAK